MQDKLKQVEEKKTEKLRYLKPKNCKDGGKDGIAGWRYNLGIIFSHKIACLCRIVLKPHTPCLKSKCLEPHNC